MAREVASIFVDVDVTDMLVVPTCQRAAQDLVRTGEAIDVEKDFLLERVRDGTLPPGGATPPPELLTAIANATAVAGVLCVMTPTAATAVCLSAHHLACKPVPAQQLLLGSAGNMPYTIHTRPAAVIYTIHTCPAAVMYTIHTRPAAVGCAVCGVVTQCVLKVGSRGTLV
jgi:hypothetical protein